MNRRMTIIALAALCALALSAIAASGASAGTTAYTCVVAPGVGSHFSDEDCKNIDNVTPGKFGHVAIASNQKTTTKTVSTGFWSLFGKLFGANVELSATGVECVGCSGENKEVGGVMEVTGTGGKLRFTGVKVVGAESVCTVVGSATGTITTQPLKFTTTLVTGVTLEPVTGTLLAEFNITGGSCPVSGTGIKATGRARVTLAGAKLTFNVTKASEELKLEGEKATLKGEGTAEAGSGATHHPVSLTTV